MTVSYVITTDAPRDVRFARTPLDSENVADCALPLVHADEVYSVRRTCSVELARTMWNERSAAGYTQPGAVTAAPVGSAI